MTWKASHIPVLDDIRSALITRQSLGFALVCPRRHPYRCSYPPRWSPHKLPLSDNRYHTKLLCILGAVQEVVRSLRQVAHHARGGVRLVEGTAVREYSRWTARLTGAEPTTLRGEEDVGPQGAPLRVEKPQGHRAVALRGLSVDLSVAARMVVERGRRWEEVWLDLRLPNNSIIYQNREPAPAFPLIGSPKSMLRRLEFDGLSTGEQEYIAAFRLIRFRPKFKQNTCISTTSVSPAILRMAFVTDLYETAIGTPGNFPRNKQPATALNIRIVRELQHTVAPHVFNPPAVYDGQRKMYALVDLPMEDTGSEFKVVLPNSGEAMAYTISLTRAGVIDTSVLHRFIEGTQTHDTSVNDAFQALNVALRMIPLSTLPTGKERRIFYTENGAKSIGSGVVLWRGYFQSLRPGISRLFLNVDVSTGAMYRPGPLIALALECLDDVRDVPALMRALRNRTQHEKLARFIIGARVTWDRVGAATMERSIKGLGDNSADREMFTQRDGQQKSVAGYFRSIANRGLQYPGLPCVQVGRVEGGKGALVPMELCTVLPGQPLRGGLPHGLERKFIEFGARSPADRLRVVNEGLETLAYSQSEYVRDFGITVKTPVLSTDARVLNPPALRYTPASGGQAESIVYPRDGNWNIIRKHFYQAATIESWVFVSFAPHIQPIVGEVIDRFVRACRDAGVEFLRSNPTMSIHLLPQGDIIKQLDDVEKQCVTQNGKKPSMFFMVLPNEGSDTVYRSIKHWGDVKRGLVTQCIRENTCSMQRTHLQPEAQIWSNIAHKVNAKLGGINVIPDTSASSLPGGVPLLGDPQNGTLVIGADVTHPPAGGTAQPSTAAVVGSVDAHASKYVATLHMQAERQEMILNLHDMTMYLLTRYMRYRRQNENVAAEHEAPKRIIFYRDGVSAEGQFQAVIDKELPLIKSGVLLPCCFHLFTVYYRSLRFIEHQTQDYPRSGWKAPPHAVSVERPMFPGEELFFMALVSYRFFDEDKNCPSGTVIDRDVVHPIQFDFYLYGHGHRGSRGTSRPAHYSVLHDENNLTPDALQTLSFALCHLYARSTRAISIPAPIYYADKVAHSRSNHFDPKSPSPDSSIKSYNRAFTELHDAQKDLMYFV
ncbi:Piwi domain-containing protein [Mycena galericulata]|nr:Piwi domain-containing protein [Mycena galericulata]